MESTSFPANRLAASSSPYLLQHAHNPVDWWPWCDEAFEEARRRGVPIFLSIGYATCYWCHVMERESFEDPGTARVMNELFVCIKLDREERPDLDELYMAATQIMTGRGGWPMSVFVEPELRRPFWCGTYFPRDPRHGLPSFTDVLRRISNAWGVQRDEVIEQAATLASGVAEHIGMRGDAVRVGPEHVQAAAASLLQLHDAQEGGFGGAPKFPQPVYLDLLLDVREVASDDATSKAVDAAMRKSLDRMAVGGLFDQVGGGFHRYCVDGTWTVPHFEKMLYDNAQLAETYLRASVVYDDAYYGEIAGRTLDYVIREMTEDGGGFRSAQDAEVRGREGLNYLWNAEQFAEVLGGEDAAFAGHLYGLDRGTNFSDPHHPDEPAANVVRMDARPDPAFDDRRRSVNERLYAARQGREQPRMDDKVLAGWNGMMIAAMARGWAVLGDARYAEAARAAARFVLGTMREADGSLCRSWRGGVFARASVLEDYAHMTRGLAGMHAAGVDGGDWLAAAGELAAVAFERFAGEAGDLYDTPDDRGDVFVRPRASYDGAMPSARGVMLHACLDLHAATGDGVHLDRAIGLARALSPEIAERSVAVANATRGLLRLLRMGAVIVERVSAGAEAAAAPTTPADRDDFQPVAVFADAERVRVGEDSPAVVNVVLRIAEGWHVVAENPGAAGLVPFRVGLVSGGGVAVYADYPEGTPLASGPDEAGGVLVYEGTVEMKVVIEKADGVGVGPGTPILGVSYQACTDTACSAPSALELGIAVDLD